MRCRFAVSHRHSRQDPVRGRWGALDLESRRGTVASLGDQTGTGRRVGGLLSCGGAPGQDRGLAGALDGTGASDVDSSPTATSSEGKDRRGANGDRRTLWPALEQGVETGAWVLQAEW